MISMQFWLAVNRHIVELEMTFYRCSIPAWSIGIVGLHRQAYWILMSCRIDVDHLSGTELGRINDVFSVNKHPI